MNNLGIINKTRVHVDQVDNPLPQWKTAFMNTFDMALMMNKGMTIVQGNWNVENHGQVQNQRVPKVPNMDELYLRSFATLADNTYKTWQNKGPIPTILLRQLKGDIDYNNFVLAEQELNYQVGIVAALAFDPNAPLELPNDVAYTSVKEVAVKNELRNRDISFFLLSRQNITVTADTSPKNIVLTDLQSDFVKKTSKISLINAYCQHLSQYCMNAPTLHFSWCLKRIFTEDIQRVFDGQPVSPVLKLFLDSFQEGDIKIEAFSNENRKKDLTDNDYIRSMKRKGLKCSPPALYHLFFLKERTGTSDYSGGGADPKDWFYSFCSVVYSSGHGTNDVIGAMMSVACGAYLDDNVENFQCRVDNQPIQLNLRSVRESWIFKTDDVRKNSNCLRAYYGFLKLGLHKNVIFNPMIYPNKPSVWYASHRYSGASNEEIKTCIMSVLNAQKNITNGGSMRSCRAAIKQAEKVHGEEKIREVLGNEKNYLIVKEYWSEKIDDNNLSIDLSNKKIAQKFKESLTIGLQNAGSEISSKILNNEKMNKTLDKWIDGISLF
jgi:hypothetical protein